MTIAERIQAFLPFQKAFSLTLLLALVLAVPACQTPTSDFPEVPYDTASEEDERLEGSETVALEDYEATLTVALPVGQEALEMLRLFFLADQQKAFEEHQGEALGQTISTDELQPYDAPLKLDLIPVSLEQGALQETVRTWLAVDELPDVVYSQSALPVIEKEGQAFDFRGLLAEDSRLMPSKVHAAAFAESAKQDRISGIPFLATVPLLFADEAFLTENGVSLRDELSLSAFATMLDELQEALVDSNQDLTQATLENLAQASDEERRAYLSQAKVLFANPHHLIGWLPAQLDERLGWMASDGDSFLLGDALPAWRFLAQLVAEGKTPYHLPPDFSQEAGFSQPLVQNRRAVFWIDDSSRLPYWQQYRDFEVTSTYLPLSQDGEGVEPSESSLAESALPLSLGRQPVDLRYLIVADGRAHSELSAKFATFMALDADALLLQSRFQLYEGFMPMLRDDRVWQAMVARQPYGHVLMGLNQRMTSTVLAGNASLISRPIAESLAFDLWQETWQHAAQENLDQEVSVPADTMQQAFMPGLREWQGRLEDTLEVDAP